MADNIIRTFHPVGQGAFYSERIDNFNLVYDCGTKSEKNLLAPVVAQSFNRQDIINILVISHFDEDHINLIPKLKETVKDIQTVIYPLMSPEQKAFFLSTYEDKNLYDIVLNPQEYFNGAKIIWIRPADRERDYYYNNEERPPYSIENLEDEQRIDSGKGISIPVSADWIFIPYNHDDGSKSKLITTLFEKTFKDDKDFDIDNIADSLSKSHICNKIRAIYKDKSIGGTNENSLLMYSGPIKKDTYYIRRHIQYLYCHFCRPIISHYIGCIYTGDATIDTNILNWINAIKKYYDVGTIQIPHHGSLKSFNPSLLDNGPFFCVISVGKNNTHKHPSCKVLADILSRDCHPIQVTNDPTTCFIEHIVKY